MSIAEKMRRAGQNVVDAVPFSAHLLAPLLRAADRLQGGELHRHAQENIDLFCTPEQKANPAYIRHLKRDMWYCAVRYVCAFNEYFLFDYPRLNHSGRMEFVNEFEKQDVCDRLGTAEDKNVLRDKWRSYEQFKKYYHRDAIKLDDGTTEEDLRQFVEKHPRFLIKPRDDSSGNGVHFCDTASGFSPSAFLEQHRSDRVLLEEPIVQCEAMARLHPQSVNTVRCATFTMDGQAHILFTFLRVGRGDSIVDNGGAGGFVCLLDTDNGIVTTPGTTEVLERELVHPDTGTQLLGFRVPRWEEMLALASELALSYPEQPYISWDLALTDGGWIVVESNSTGQFIGPQFTTQHGLRAQLSPYFDLRW